MRELNSVVSAGILKPVIDLICNSNAPVLASGTSDRNNQLILSLLYITGDKERQHIIELIHKLFAGRKALYIVLYRLVIPGKRLKLIDIIWVWQKSYIKDKVCI